MSSLPSNVHISQHPCLKAKISQLRSQSTGARDAKRLIHDISTMLGYEALGSALSTTQQGSVRVPIHPKLCIPLTTSKDQSPLGYEYPIDSISPSHVSLVPILRSGLSMVDGMSFPPHPHQTTLSNLLPKSPPLHPPRPSPSLPPRNVPRKNHPPTRRILQQSPLPLRNKNLYANHSFRNSYFARSYYRYGCYG
jgi:uracil phosphoribosyltransferase